VLCWLLGTSVRKTGEISGEDQHCVKKSEWTVLNFSLSQAARKSDEERRQRFFLKSLFSERMSQVASTGVEKGDNIGQVACIACLFLAAA